MKTNKTRARSSGQVLVALIFFLPIIVAAAAIAIDMSRLVAARADLQRGLDAAALAGARALYDPNPTEDKIRTTVVQLAAQHTVYGTVGTLGARALTLDRNDTNAKTGDVVLGTWDFTKAYDQFTEAATPVDLTKVNAVKVSTAISHAASFVSTPFGGALGQGRRDVTRTSIAVVGGPSTLKPSFPMLVDYKVFQGLLTGTAPSQTIRLTPDQGNASWTGFGTGNNANNYRSYILNPTAIPNVARGSKQPAGNGVVDSAYQAAADKYPANGPNNQIVVAVADLSTGEVYGFAKLNIVQVAAAGHHSTIDAQVMSLTPNMADTRGLNTLNTCYAYACRALLVNDPA